MSDETPNEDAPPKKGASNLALRLATAAVGIPIILWMLYLAPAYVFSLVAIVFAGIGAHELGKMTQRGEPILRFWLLLATVSAAAVIILAPSADGLLTLLFGVVLTGALASLFRPDPLSAAGGRMGWLIAGPLYVGGGFAALASLHHLPNGGTWVLLSMCFAWGSDTGGYFAGRAFGKHKLYPKVSPKKTIEGSIGGLAAVVGMAVAIRFLWMPDLPLVHVIVLALLAGAAGQAGDLCISVVKRSTGVKDSGAFLPGHGGLLDRVDALVFTAPVSLLYARWVLGLEGTPIL